MAILEQELFVLGKQVSQVTAIREAEPRLMVGNVTRDGRTSRVIAAEVKKIQRPLVTLPASVRFSQATTVQVPIADVVASIFFDSHSREEERHEVDKSLIDEITFGYVYNAVLIQF